MLGAVGLSSTLKRHSPSNAGSMFSLGHSVQKNYSNPIYYILHDMIKCDVFHL